MFEYEEGEDGKFLLIKSDFDIKTYIDFIIENSVENIYINEVRGYKESNINDISKIKSIKRLKIVAYDSLDVSSLQNMVWLEYLVCRTSVSCDFTEFKKLKYLDICWSKNVFLNGNVSFMTLNIQGFKGEMGELNCLPRLKSLGLIQSNITNLGFLEKCFNLESLFIAYCRSFKDCEGLVHIGKTLKKLELDSCKKIKYAKIFWKLPNINVLKISNCSPLPDLSFVPSLKKLTFISFVETTIKSGDLKPCLNIEYVGTLNKRAYNCEKKDGKLVVRSVQKQIVIKR